VADERSERVHIAVLIGSLLVIAGLLTWAVLGNPHATTLAVSHEAGISAVVSAGWKTSGLDTAKPTFSLSLWSDANGRHDDCGRDAGVRMVIQLSVSEVKADQPDEGDQASPTELTYPPRPSQFGPGSGSGLRQFTPDEDCGEHHQTIRFTDHGRRFVAQLDFAADDPHQRRADAYEILNSLEVQP
jgi:hypothetical protein